MDQPKPLAERRTSVFADGAARFAEIAHSVKAQQIAERQGAGTMPAPQTPSPDEVWARNYMSQAIGPQGTETIAALSPRAQAHGFAPALSALRPLARRVELAPKPDLARALRPTGDAVPMEIGLRGDAPVRRTWLARLFGRA